MKTGNALAVVIPRDFLRAMGWARGDQVTLSAIDDNHLVVRRLSDAELMSLRPKYISYE